MIASESKSCTVAKLEEEKAKVERRSILMRRQSERLLAAPTHADDKGLPSLDELKKEALETEDMLASLHEIMNSIHSAASALSGDELDYEEDDDDYDEFGGDSEEGEHDSDIKDDGKDDAVCPSISNENRQETPK